MNNSYRKLSLSFLMCLFPFQLIAGDVPTIMSENAVKVTSAVDDERVLPPALKLLKDAGAEIYESFPTEMGLTGYLGKANEQYTVFYVTRDGKYAIIGAVLDESGLNLTAKYVQEKAPVAPVKDYSELWKGLESSTYIEEGTGPNTMYVFYEPNCGACASYYERTREYLGQLNIRWIPVAFLTPKSPDIITALLKSDDPAAALATHQSKRKNGDSSLLVPADKTILAKIKHNGDLMKQAEVTGTPATFFKDPGGVVRKAPGALSVNTLSAIASIKVADNNGTVAHSIEIDKLPVTQ